jgi:plasmid maintenance system killer protein
MIINFADHVTEDIFNGLDTKRARRIPSVVWRIAIRKFDMLNAAHELKDLSELTINLELFSNGSTETQEMFK